MGNTLDSSNEQAKTPKSIQPHQSQNNTINKKLSEVQRKLYDDYMGIVQDPTTIDPEYDGYKKLASQVKEYIPKKKYKSPRKKANE